MQRIEEGQGCLVVALLDQFRKEAQLMAAVVAEDGHALLHFL